MVFSNEEEENQAEARKAWCAAGAWVELSHRVAVKCERDIEKDCPSRGGGGGPSLGSAEKGRPERYVRSELTTWAQLRVAEEG